jgi:hypothetical protein
MKPAAWGEHGDGVLCFLLCVVCCCMCKWWLVLVFLTLAHKYNISYYGIVLGEGISIIVLDTYAILVKIWRGKMAGEKISDKSVVSVVCCKKLLSTTTISPMANMRCTYEGIGIYVDDWSFAVVYL